MPERRTAESRVVEYETNECVHCGDVVFVDSQMENIDQIPEGINVVIGTGEHITVEKTSRSTRTKDHRTPEIITKWFSSDEGNVVLEDQYMCPSCASSIYGFSSNK